MGEVGYLLWEAVAAVVEDEGAAATAVDGLPELGGLQAHPTWLPLLVAGDMFEAVVSSFGVGEVAGDGLGSSHGPQLIMNVDEAKSQIYNTMHECISIVRAHDFPGN